MHFRFKLFMIILNIISYRWINQKGKEFMIKLNTNSKKGFTIIEVVLVLAIAGLIFLMVFVALPNLQRTQRDTQRRNDLDRLSTSLTQYITNNNKLPNDAQADAMAADAMGDTQWGKFAQNYLLASGEDTFQDPNGSPYGLVVLASAPNKQDNALSAQFGTTEVKTTGTGGSSVTGTGVMVIAKGAKCSSDLETNAFAEANGNRSYAVAMRLEGSGVYCVDNH